MRTSLALMMGLAAFASLPVGAVMLDLNWSETAFSVNRNTPGDNSGKSHTGLAWAPDGSDRLFVLEKNGRVRILSGLLSTGTGTWSTFATMSPIFTNSECGLIGMAFDPDFVNNRFVYFFVTVSSGEQQIIRYNAATNVGSGRSVIVDDLPTVGNNHDGGGIGFAADGKLYWGIGDLGNGTGVDANLSSLASKVGRANRDGSLPDDNPFDDGAGTNNDFIFARGMRNPFTMQIQPATGRIWLNVVGDGYEQVFVVGAADHGGYNDFENNQPAPTLDNQYITPIIVYPTSNSPVELPLTGATRSGNISTFTTSGSHRLRVGSNVEITGVSNSSFNLPNQHVASVVSPTVFTVQQPGANVSGTGGTAETLAQGRCLTGGAFYDATLAPLEYQGNFFYGDCSSGRIMRARLDPAGDQVLRVDHWASGISGQVDVAQGPDGALYYTGNSTNTIYRAAYNTAVQALVVGSLNLRIDEGGDAVTTVRLALAPVAPVQVSIARSAGDDDVSIAAGASLNFTTDNWQIPQAVRVAARNDLDQDDDEAIVTVSSAGLASVDVRASVLDLGALQATEIFANGFEP